MLIALGAIVVIAVGVGGHQLGYLRGYSDGVAFAMRQIDKVIDTGDNKPQS